MNVISNAVALLYYTASDGQWPSHAQLVALIEAPTLIDALLIPDLDGEALNQLFQSQWWNAPTVTLTTTSLLRPLQDGDYLACHGRIWRVEQRRLVLHELSCTLGLQFSSRAVLDDTEPFNVAQLRELVRHLSRVTLLPKQRAVQHQERLLLTVAIHTDAVIEVLTKRNERRTRALAAGLMMPSLAEVTVTTELRLFDAR